MASTINLAIYLILNLNLDRDLALDRDRDLVLTKIFLRTRNIEQD